MFQGSRNVGKAEHMALVQAAGGTMNGSTWLDRTNYYETLPSHQAELALWLEADRMGTLLDALSQENLDNQREVVKNEKRWSYDNRPYGSWYEKLQGHLFPPDHPYHHTTIGSMEDLDAASVEDVSAFFRTYYAPNNAVLSVVGDVDPDDDPALDRALLRRHPGEPVHPAARRPVAAADPRRGASARPSTTRSRCRGSTSGSGRRSSATTRLDALDIAAQVLAGGKGSASIAGSSATSGSPRTSRCSRSGSSAGRRSAPAGRRSGRASTVERVEAAFHEELERLAREPVSDDELARAQRADRDRGARRRCRGSRSGPTGSRCTRRCSTTRTSINRMLPRYLAVTADQIRDVAADVFRADNRVVLTYLPELPPAETASTRCRGRPASRDRGRRGGRGMTRHDDVDGRRRAARRPARRGRTTSRPSSGRGCANGLPLVVVRPARAGRSSPRRSSSATAPPTSPTADGGRDRPRRPGADRGHRALRRDRPRRGRGAARARRSTPRPAGTR